MEPLAYLKVLARRWRIVAACVVLALAVAWMTTPAKPGSAPSLTTYQTTVTLIPPADSFTTANLPLAAYLVTAGDVPALAAKAIGYRGSPADLASSVTATANADIGSVDITASDSDRARSVAIATAFADATVTFLRDSGERLRGDTAVAAKQQLDVIDQRITNLQAQLAAATGSEQDILRTRLNTELTRYGLVYQRLQDLTQPIDPRTDLQRLGTPTTKATVQAGISAPESRSARLLLLGLLGLLLGVIAAIVVDRLDVRLRSRDAVEAAFDAPVLAEVPRQSRRAGRLREIAVRDDPAGPTAEAYRTVRSAVLLAALEPQTPRAVTGLQVPANLKAPGGPQVVLVGSARARDGKTTTVANLAAALAEAERSVLVVDCDLRKPDVSGLLDVPPGLGLADLVTGGEGSQTLSRVIRPSAIPGVHVVTAGASAPDNPAVVLLRMGSILQEARRHADVVLVDSAPMLVANDTNDLMRYVDAVVLSCRAGHVTAEQAGRVRQLLGRVAKPVIGVVLTGVPTAPRLHASRGSSALASPRVRRQLQSVAGHAPKHGWADRQPDTASLDDGARLGGSGAEAASD